MSGSNTTPPPWKVDDATLVQSAVRNAGRLQPRAPRWSHVTDVLAVGSTSAWALCRRFDLDPNEIVGVDDEEGEE